MHLIVARIIRMHLSRKDVKQTLMPFNLWMLPDKTQAKKAKTEKVQ